jgi:hypothetical protein
MNVGCMHLADMVTGSLYGEIGFRGEAGGEA